MIFSNLRFSDTKQQGASLTSESCSSSDSSSDDHSLPWEIGVRRYTEKLRSASNVVSGNNQLSIILIPLMHRKGQECLRRALIRPANHNDHKRPKLAEIDSSTYIENTPIYY